MRNLGARCIVCLLIIGWVAGCQLAELGPKLGEVADLKDPLKEVADLGDPMERVAALQPDLEAVAQLGEPLRAVAGLKPVLEDVAGLETPMGNLAALQEPMVQLAEPVSVLTRLTPVQRAASVLFAALAFFGLLFLTIWAAIRLALRRHCA